MARNIRVERGGKSILRGVDLEAEKGEVVGVLGPSGAGKSTLFRVLVGEFVGEPGGVRAGRSREGRPGDQGTILLAGQDVTRWPLWKRARAGMGYVPQEPSVLWDLTVQGNLRAFRQIAGLPAPDDATREAGRDALGWKAGSTCGPANCREVSGAGWSWRAQLRGPHACSYATSRLPGWTQRVPSAWDSSCAR